MSDPTGGYKCYSAEVLRAIDLDRIVSNGYSFQMETTFTAWTKGFRIAEVPIVFLDRRVGYSKHMLQIRAERALGHTLGDEIRRMRLSAAKEMVAETDMPMADVAEACGFTSVSHLAMRFRENFGVTPLAWRRTGRVSG